jgi:short-subunit dehydrogenase
MSDKDPLSVCITGAGSGLGRGAALGLARVGCAVLAAVQYPQQVTELRALAMQEQVDLRVEKVDLLKPSERSFLVGQDIDVLVNNAAVSETGPISEQPLELVREVFETNVFSSLALTQGVVRGMVSRGRGRVIFVSSIAGLMAVPYLGAYCASKHAIEAIAGAMQAELEPHSVQVLVFQPGPYNTGFNARMWDTSERWMNTMPHFTRRSDMERTAALVREGQLDPQEAVAALVSLVQSPEPRFRNVVPLAVEEMVKTYQQAVWTRAS